MYIFQICAAMKQLLHIVSLHYLPVIKMYHYCHFSLSRVTGLVSTPPVYFSTGSLQLEVFVSRTHNSALCTGSVQHSDYGFAKAFRVHKDNFYPLWFLKNIFKFIFFAQSSVLMQHILTTSLPHYSQKIALFRKGIHGCHPRTIPLTHPLGHASGVLCDLGKSQQSFTT